jgi:transcriptional regulator NrdR family protein
MNVEPKGKKDNYDDLSHSGVDSEEKVSGTESEKETQEIGKNILNKLHDNESTKPIFNINVYYDFDMQSIKYNIEKLQPQLNEMYDKAVNFNQDYDLSLIADAKKNIQAYEDRLSEISPRNYIKHFFYKIIGIFRTQEPSKAEAAINLMSNLWHFKLSKDQQNIVEAMVKSKVGDLNYVNIHNKDKENFYHGTFRDGKIGGVPEGEGCISYGSGDYYAGYFLNELPHGQGTLTYGEDSTYSTFGADPKADPKYSKYIGQFEDGKPHGKGRLEDKKGNIYIGEFQKGKPHGKVKIIYKDPDGPESAYVLCKEGKKIQGIIIYNDQSRFIGYFDENGEKYNGVLTTNYGLKLEIVERMKKGYNGIHPNQDGTTLEYRNGLPWEGFLFNNLNEKLEYHEGKAYNGTLTNLDGLKVVYVNGTLVDGIRGYKKGKPVNTIFKYPNGEELIYREGKPYQGTLLQLDGKHVHYSEGIRLDGIITNPISGEKIEYKAGLPYEGTLVKTDGTRIKYEEGKLFNDFVEVKDKDNNVKYRIEYRDGRPYQGTLVYPNTDFQLEYVNGRPYKGVLIKANEKVEYKLGKATPILSNI